MARATLANWRTSPWNRWAFHHVRELVPSADIPGDPRRVVELRPADMGLEKLGWLNEFVEQTDTDGFVVVHRGRLVLEHYANGMTADSPHILMSVSKSMLGLLVGRLVARGELDPERQVSDVLPELRETAYRGASIRHLLDMRAGIAFDEDYLAGAGPMIAYRKATGWNPLEPGDEPSDLHSFLRTLQQSDGAHGGRFHYVSPNTDLLGWVIERATGRRYAELMSELVWRPAGAARDAYITVDRLGAPRCAGGLCATTRDLARVGQWILRQGGRWVDDLVHGGSREAWDAGAFVTYFPGLPMRYRSQWYALDGDAPLLFGFGIHGQHLFIDRARALVIAKFSSQAQPLDAGHIRLTMQAVSRLRELFDGP